MEIKSKIKHLISFLLHGERKPLYAQISYLSPNNRLSGKKIVVTGGNRGLGLSMAKKFISEGAEVLITGRSSDELNKVATDLGCKCKCLDVSNTIAFNGFFKEVSEVMGG